MKKNKIILILLLLFVCGCQESPTATNETRLQGTWAITIYSPNQDDVIIKIATSPNKVYISMYGNYEMPGSMTSEYTMQPATDTIFCGIAYHNDLKYKFGGMIMDKDTWVGYFSRESEEMPEMDYQSHVRGVRL